jgi:hypothetical protein
MKVHDYRLCELPLISRVMSTVEEEATASVAGGRRLPGSAGRARGRRASERQRARSAQTDDDDAPFQPPLPLKTSTT